MPKPYKTIQEQIELLNARGVVTNDTTDRVLMREGYYSIVNGYKTPFIDAAATKATGDDRYKPGTKFSDIHALFLFDRSLRKLTFHYLIRVEALVKTACAYTFSEKHPEPEDYLKQENFATEEEYAEFGLRNYVSNMHKLHTALFDKATRSDREFIAHYRNNHGWVPLWVLTNELTFGNIEHFFNLMKPEEQTLVCRRIVKATGLEGSSLGYFSPKELRRGLDVIVKVRNMCAHDERLYCARIGRRRNAKYLDFLKYVQRYLPPDEYDAFIADINVRVKTYSEKSDLVAHVLRGMGFAAS